MREGLRAASAPWGQGAQYSRAELSEGHVEPHLIWDSRVSPSSMMLVVSLHDVSEKD